MRQRFRIVIDTNTLLRGLVSASSAAARVRRAAERRVVIPLLSKNILDEYRAVLLDDLIVDKFPQITPQIVEISIRRLRFIGEYVRSTEARFAYPRDPSDQKFIELAIDLQATHILTSDKDLLSLPGGRSDAARRFRQRLSSVEVMEAGNFIRDYGAVLSI